MSATPTKRAAETQSSDSLCLPAKLSRSNDSGIFSGSSQNSDISDGSTVKLSGFSDSGSCGNSQNSDISDTNIGGDGGGDCQLPDKFRINSFSPCNSQSKTQVASSGSSTGKRQDFLSWSEYFMAVAFLSAQRSKDPSSQVGACIVNSEKKIVGIGYNGMPNGCSDDQLPWARTAEDKLDTKYPYVCHAEMNAIMNKNSADVKGCTIYVALFPCNECAKLIIQSGIRQVIYLSDKYFDRPEFVASRRLLSMAGVECRKFEPKNRQLVINFDSI